MMNDKSVSGIICEFNPFHNGHKYLIEKVKEETDGFVVCVMSGNYVQRGEAAIIDKYTRTETALVCGADLVIEMPVQYTASTAEKFAECGVYLLDKLGCVDNIYFGSECGDVRKLRELSSYLLSEKFSETLTETKSVNESFASSREKAVLKDFGKEYADIIGCPNNILGIEYIKAVLNLKSDIEPKTIQRTGAEHDAEGDGEISSASHIRKLIRSGDNFRELMPEHSYELVKSRIAENKAPADMNYIERTALYRLRTMSADELKEYPDVSEGLENKIKEAACKAKNLDELYSLIKTKRYSHARIRRIVLSVLLDIKKTDMILPPYIRVLGMNSNGLEMLRLKQNKIPFVTAYKDAAKLGDNAIAQFELEARVDDIYSLCLPEISAGKAYYTTSIIKV
ncbi:MAG: nucleotidyltransferase [Clostridia bacterium]|nr:nucleotidyltransferase [Clostridia bacterium]